MSEPTEQEQLHNLTGEDFNINWDRPQPIWLGPQGIQTAQPQPAPLPEIPALDGVVGQISEQSMSFDEFHQNTSPVERERVDWATSNRDMWAGAFSNSRPRSTGRASVSPHLLYDYDEDEDINSTAEIQPRNVKKGKPKVVTIDKETFTAIEDILTEINKELTIKLETIYKIRLDNLDKRGDNGFFANYNQYRDNENKLVNDLISINGLIQALSTKGMLFSNGSAMQALEEKAKARYHIEHSKYKYYPRLKATVKYGNPELLAKILTVTQIGMGHIVCK